MQKKHTKWNACIFNGCNRMQESKATHIPNEMQIDTHRTHTRIASLPFGDSANLPMIHSIEKCANTNFVHPHFVSRKNIDIGSTTIDEMVYMWKSPRSYWWYVCINRARVYKRMKARQRKRLWIFYLAIDVFMTHDNTCFMCPSRSMHVVSFSIPSAN